MVFALAGDSTITSDLAMLSFIPSCLHWMLSAILRTSYHYIQVFLCGGVLYFPATFHPSCNSPGWSQQDFEELLPRQLAYHAFKLQVKQSRQHLGRSQP